MQRKKGKKLISMALAASMVLTMTACGSSSEDGDKADNSSKEVPTIDKINVGEDYKDISAEIHILTDRTDIVDTKYKEYADTFNKEYPNIKVTYEAVTDYAENITLRLTNGDWGDICFIPTTVDKKDLGTYFAPLGDFSTLDATYNFVVEKTFDNTVYGIPNGGTAGGVAYNKKVWKEAGIEELPKTPDEFLDDLKLIKSNTKATPLYTNFSAGWTMGAWNDYVGIASNGDPD